MNDIQQFSDAIIKGASSPGITGPIPEVSNAMAASFQLGGMQRAGRAQGVVAGQIADDEEKRRRAAAEAQMRAIQDQADPSKYNKLRKDDGGFAFFDPSGKEIDIDTYAKRTGQRRVDVIKDSENPVDQQFIDDYEQMNDLNQAVWKNDAAAISEYKSLFPELFSGNKSPTPEEINRKLLEKYPHIYGMGNYQVSKANLGNPVFRAIGSASGSNIGD